ncbi:MAG: triose-phosphate isomerase [Eubacteriales bacterium]|nr:triose-phosphate isomerase [Eubacteriales bacterium]
MREPIIAGNWKMNMTPAEARKLIRELKPLVADATCTVVVCPPFVCLDAVRKAIAGSNIHLGAQNMHWAEKGAFTGEISGSMLQALNVEYVIVGHSERRTYFGDTDETVNRRLLAVLSHGMTPIVCVGETLEQRERGQTEKLIKDQIAAAFAGVDEPERVVVAYEPIWAIGTGKTATAEQADSVIGFIRDCLAEKYGKRAANKVRIQYGGSMNPKNAHELMAMKQIDGGLIGGASLKATDFAAVVKY